MAQFNANIAQEVLAACQAGAAETGLALTRALDSQIEVTVGEATHYSQSKPPEDLDGPGLAIVFTFENEAAVALLPESVGFLPQWYGAPDPTGQSKLTTMAQELSMLLVPEEFITDQFQAGKVGNLREALNRAQLAEEAALIPLNLQSGDQRGVLQLIWPVSNWSEIFKATEQEASERQPGATVSAGDRAKAASALQPASAPALSPQISYEDEFDRLPPYSRSLLRIKLPLMVNLASKKQSIDKIIELGAGTIIKFEKSCDELLELEVNGHPVARGEAVKVGDKFGLRISSMIIPEEQFKKLERRASS